VSRYDRWFAAVLVLGALLWVFLVPGGAVLVALILLAILVRDGRRA
jgi:hypothetical protein